MMRWWRRSWFPSVVSNSQYHIAAFSPDLVRLSLLSLVRYGPPPNLVYSRRQANNDRNTKHGRGGRAPARDGKRAYDRRSGTGRGKEIKKEGGGARNWGNDKTEAKKMEGKIDEEAVEKPTEEAEVVVEEPEVVEPEPEPDNTMTLAEYMAAKQQKKEEKVREVDNEFAGKAAAKKVEEDFLVMGEEKSKKKKQAKDNKVTLDVNFRVVSCVVNAGAQLTGISFSLSSLQFYRRLSGPQ